MLATMRSHAELPVHTMVYSVGTTRVHRHRAGLFVVQHDVKPYIRVDGSMNISATDNNRAQ